MKVGIIILTRLAMLAAMVLSILGSGAVNTPVAHASTPNPASDPNNTQSWVYMDEFSDEFDGSSLDTNKWQTLPITWRDGWRWDSSQVNESGGNLNLTMAYNPSDEFNQTPVGWKSILYNDGKSDQADYITTDLHRTGNSALVHYFYYPYHVQTQQTINSLANGMYTFSAYVWSSGSQSLMRLVASGCGGATQYANISGNNGDYTQYSITNINVTAGQCTIGIESDSPAYSWLRIDDVSFSNNSMPSVNLSTNPGFETRKMTYYESGGIRSLSDIKYGYLEARIDGSTPIPGTCPAFWMKSIDDIWGNEIDVMEFGETLGNIYKLDMTLHNWKKPGYTTAWHSAGSYTGTFDPSAGYHTCGFDWGPGYQKWYIDGVLRRTTNFADYDQMPMQIYASLGLRPPY